jgi:hypothetical protein
VNSKPFVISGLIAAWLLATIALPAAENASLKMLAGHVPRLPTGLASSGQLPATNRLRLAIGLPLRDRVGLDEFLAELYDPAGTKYHCYLTPREFTERFGPTREDYQAVLKFAQAQGLTISRTHGNRLLVDVAGSVGQIEAAFHLTLLTYRHPSEARDFYAPDREPAVPVGLPVADISGLDNCCAPRPMLKVAPAPAGIGRATGSGPSGTYMGNDFRAAYLPGVTLTGAGQALGLAQFDGFYSSDIKAYAATAGISVPPIQVVLLDDFSGTPTTGPDSGNIEVSLDIEMAMSMAPGLTNLVVFEAGPYGIPNDILNAMAASNQIKQLSCSWGWGGGPTNTTDSIFEQMEAQGQSFFIASGDSDAYTTGGSSANGVDNPSLDNTPSSNPYITVVGGTTLTTTTAGGAWTSETVWNWGLDDGKYVGSSGGISSHYSIPSWQKGVSMSANGGSTSFRNLPDVALVADNVYVAYGDGSESTVGGTSCATPLWAALTALINQQAVSAGRTNVGFLNPAIYALGESAAFTNVFHDITTGNNVSADSPNLFYAMTGYDLCTGWGTPYGQSLINALSGVPNWVEPIPAAGFTAVGPVSGPFSPASETFVLTNGDSSSHAWSLIDTASWLSVSTTNGTLAAGGAISVSVSVAAAAGNLGPGIYNTSLVLTNHGGGVTALAFALSVSQSIVQNGGFETGSFADWTLSGDTVVGSEIYDAVEDSGSGYLVVHSGNYGAFLGDTHLASLSQTLSTVPGQYYLLSLWLDNPTSGTVQQFTLNWNTNTTSDNHIFGLLDPPAFSWTNLEFLAAATGTNTTLLIQAENDPSYFGLDDVSVTPIPPATFTALAKSAGGVRLSWVAATNLTYQVQYKTNLLQTNWLALVGTVTATNYSASLQDTGAFSLSAIRFYRLVVSP